MLRSLFCLGCVHGACLLDGTYQTSLQSLPFKHLPHHGIQDCIPVLKKMVSNFQPNWCFLSGPNVQKSMGMRYGLQGRWSITFCLYHHNKPHINSMSPSHFCIFGTLKKEVADQQFATENDMTQAFTYWLQTLDTSFFHARIQAFMPQWYKGLINSYDHIKV